MSDTRNHTTRDQLAKALFAAEQCDKRQAQDIDANWDGRLNERDQQDYRDLADALLASDAIAAVRAAAVAETTAAIETRAFAERFLDEWATPYFGDDRADAVEAVRRSLRAALSGGRTALDTCGHPNHHGPDHDCTPFRADTGAAESSTCTCGDPVAGPICHHVFPPAEEQPR